MILHMVREASVCKQIKYSFLQKHDTFHEEKHQGEAGNYVTKQGLSYLENFLLMGRNKTMKFKKLKERVQSWLQCWQSQLFSLVCRITFIRSVIQAVPVYDMAIIGYQRHSVMKWKPCLVGFGGVSNTIIKVFLR